MQAQKLTPDLDLPSGPEAWNAAALLSLPSVAMAAPWREEPVVAALFRKAGVEGTFVLLDESSGDLRGTNHQRAEQRFAPDSTL